MVGKRKRKERPRHCILGKDYMEEKCKDIECKFKGLCKKMKKNLVLRNLVWVNYVEPYY